MMKINSALLIVTFMIISQLSIIAQNNTNSPYTRYGYGDLGDRSFGAGRAMGGVGYGLRSPKQINPMNPASYSCMDSLTFLFDFGVAGQVSWFKENDINEHQMNGNLEYVALQFPTSHRLAFSFGLLPYSFVGYEFGQVRTEENVTFTESYNGKGGFSEIYGGLAYDLWKKRLSIGANFGYLFGDITHSQIVSMGTDQLSTTRSQKIKSHALTMDFGIQYTHPIGKRESLVFGATFSPKRQLYSDTYNYTQSYNSSSSSTETIVADTVSTRGFELANKYGFGLSYVKENKLTIAADFSFEDWNKMKYNNVDNRFNNRYRIALGTEFIPRSLGSKIYFDRVRYRAGIHYGNSYLRMNQTATNPNGNSYNEIGVGIGFGFPLIDNRSLINVTFEYMKKKPDVSENMIDEQYFRFTVNYTFNELWFFKRKL